MYKLDSLSEVKFYIRKSNLLFFQIYNILFGYGGVYELEEQFPTGNLNNKIPYPKSDKGYFSTQQEGGHTGEIVIFNNGAISYGVDVMGSFLGFYIV